MEFLLDSEDIKLLYKKHKKQKDKKLLDILKSLKSKKDYIVDCIVITEEDLKNMEETH